MSPSSKISQELGLTLGEPHLPPFYNSPLVYNLNASSSRANLQFETALQEYHLPPLYNFDPEGFEVSSETLEALSSLEPVNSTFGGQDWF